MNRTRAPSQFLRVAKNVGAFAGLLAWGGAYSQSSVTSDPGLTTQGHAPIVENVAIANQSRPGVPPRVGDVLRADYSFSDSDDDPQSGTRFEWRRNGGAIAGAIGPTYTAVAADAHRGIEVQVTPQTDPAITDPAAGSAVRSPTQVVQPLLPDIGDFVAPDRTVRSWDQATAHCASLGLRLPTPAQLQQLFVTHTSATVANGSQQNSEMCTVHGWPLRSACGGGSSSGYWTNFRYVPGASAEIVSLENGARGPQPTGVPLLAACVRP
jgi:hypothetical protein